MRLPRSIRSLACMLPELRLLVRMASLSCALAPFAASAQVATVNVSVVLEDGSPKDFVDVVLEGADGNPSEFANVTDAAGLLTFAGVPPGSYVARAFTEGHVSDGYVIELAPGARQELRIVLRPESAGTIVVEVDVDVAELLEIRSVETSTKFTGRFLEKIPLLNRSIQDIVAIMPGVIRIGSSDSPEISIAGGTGAQVGYRIDGQSANDALDGGLSHQVPTASIRTFKLITSGASARFGEQSTGVAEIVTKSGGNEPDFAYEVLLRDSDLGSQGIGGIDAASRAVNDVLTAAGSILEQEARAGFRLLGVDPVSTTADDNNPPPRQRVRHSVSAGGPIRRNVAYFHSTLEVLRDDFGSAFVDGSGQNDAILWTSKVNWNAWGDGTASNRLELTASLDNRNDDGFIGLRATPSTSTRQAATSWALGATSTHVFASRGVLESKLSLRRQVEKSRPENVRKGVGTLYRIVLPPGGPTEYFVGDANASSDESVSTLRAEANFSQAFGRRGQHVLDIGFSADRTTFESFQESGPQVTDLRIVDDSALLGEASDLAARELRFGPPLRTKGSAWFASAYASDNWQVTDNFVLQLGLRAEYQSFVGKLFLAPRIGFSLDPVGDQKTRLFGNWGIYHDRLFLNFLQFTRQPEQEYADILLMPGMSDSSRRFSVLTIEDIHRDALTRTQASQSPQAIAYRRPTIRDRFVGAADITAPTSKDWTLGASRELPGKIRLEVSFRSNERTHQIQADTYTRRAASGGQPEIRDVIYETSGRGSFRQWAAEVSRPFGKFTSLNLSYVQSRNVGPIGPPQDSVDPNDVFYVTGILGNDRTHVAKVQATTKLGKGKSAWDASADFTWQSGTPVTASLYRNNGVRLEPIGRNSLRLPSTRMLNFGVSRSFQLNTAEGGGFTPVIGIRAQVFNLLNDMNVVGALARFEAPDGIGNPQSFPPLRPDLIPTDVDVTRSVEVGFSISF